MRVFSCEAGEALTIGTDIRVTVLEVGEDFVRLGITRGDEEPAYREEIVHFESAELQPQLN